MQLRGKDDGMRTTVITEIAEYFKKEIKEEIHPRWPFVGEHFNATRAGIHADGLMKDEEIYNIFDSTNILGRPPKIIIDAYSGLAGIAMWLKSYYKSIGINEEIDKKDQRVLMLKEWIDQQYRQGRTTSIGDDELIEKLCEIDNEINMQSL